MTQIATVEKIIDDTHALIAVARETACGHKCEDCAGCGVSGGQAVRAVAINPIHAIPGEKVVVEGSTKKVLGIVALVYVVPFICFFLGYALASAVLGFGDLLSGAIGILFFAVGILPALAYNRYEKRNRTIQYQIMRRF